MGVDRNRCSSCGYLHLGPAPERCPVCGAPQTAFKSYAGAPVPAGTKTAENLKAAIAGESEANRRYTLFRRVAELEGAPESAIAAFERAAAEETAHALGELAYLGAFASTRENLAQAMGGEDEESSSMYPGFAQTAEDEGFDDLAYYFRNLGRFEGEHRDAFRKAKEELEDA